MTYTIQAIAGVVIAIGAFISIYWRKFSRYLRNKYHISLSKKEIESDEFYLFDESIDKEKIVTNPGSITNKKVEPKDNPSQNILLPGFLLAFASAFMLMVFAPLDLYLNNIKEFTFEFSMLLPVLFKMFLILFVLLLVVLGIFYLINKKIYLFILVFGFCIFLITYIHGNFMVGFLPQMDGSPVWENNRNWYYLSVVVIVFVFLIAFIVWKTIKTRKMMRMGLLSMWKHEKPLIWRT